MSVLDRLPLTGEQVMILRYITIAALALLIYEYLITIDGETVLMWPSRLSVIKVLFFLNRYVSVATAALGAYILVSSKDYGNCKPIFETASVLACSGYFFAEATLFMRVYAVWECRRSVLVLLSSIFVGAMVGVYYCTAHFLISTDPSSLRLFHSGCLLVTSNRIEWISLVILVFCETVALSLLLVKTFIYFHNSNSISALMETMYKDGILYYALILVTTIANMFVLRLEDTTLNCSLLIPQSILHSILCNRLLIRVRSVRSTANTLYRGHIPLQSN